MTTYIAIFQSSFADNKGQVYTQEFNWEGEDGPQGIEDFEKVKKELGKEQALEIYETTDLESIELFASMINLLAVSEGYVEVLDELDHSQVAPMYTPMLPQQPSLSLVVNNTVH